MGITHSFVSAIPDDPDAALAGEILPQAHWNAEHTGHERELLTEFRTYYVNPSTGSDSNNGLTTGTAFQSLQYAVLYPIRNLYNPYDYNIIVQLADGTYPVTIDGFAYLMCPPYDAGGDFIQISIWGNDANPENVIIDGGIIATGSYDIESLTINGRFIGFGGTCFVQLVNTRHGTCDIAHITCQFNAIIEVYGLEIVGTAPEYVEVGEDAFFSHRHGPLTLTVDPGWATACIHAKRFGRCYFSPDGGITGTSSGQKYWLEQHSILNIRTITESDIPGTTDGVLDSTCILSDGSNIIKPAFAMLSVEDQSLTGGVIVTSKSLGTISSGTVTPDPGDRPQQHYTNGGAHTLGVSSNAGSILVDITNNGSAGAITTSGFTKVSGDSFTTTNGHKFRCHVSIGDTGSLLVIQAMQ